MDSLRWDAIPVRENNILRSHQRNELLDRMRDDGTMRPSLLLTMKIKTNAIWAKIIRNCLLLQASRYIPNRFSSRSASVLAFILFKLQLYAAQKVEKLEVSIEGWPLFSFSSHRCDMLFISLALFLCFCLAPSRTLSIVSRSVSRDIIPTGWFSLFLFLRFFVHPPSLPAYKRFDWNRSTSRQARKQASKQAKHFKWRFFSLFLFPPLELLLASPCLLLSFSISFAPLCHHRSYLHHHCTVQATSTCNFFLLFYCMIATKKHRHY